MHKQMKLITTAGILGLFLVSNYVFEFLGKIGAGIFSAVLTGQLTQEAWNTELYTAIWTQSLPFLVMIAIGGVLIQWAGGKNKALEATEPEWAYSAPQRKETNLAVVGGLLAFAGLYNLAVPIYFGFGDLMAGLSSPESSGYVLKAVLPNYAVLLVQIALGIWLMIGRKASVTLIAETPAPAEAEAVNEGEEEARPEHEAHDEHETPAEQETPAEHETPDRQDDENNKML